MKKLHYSTAAKKDLKRYRNNPRKMKALFETLQYLLNDVTLPANYLRHRLVGQYAGCWECHIENDFLLIWIDDDAEVIDIVRIGTHSELFLE